MVLKRSIIGFFPLFVLIPYFGHLGLNNFIIGFGIFSYFILCLLSLSYVKKFDINISKIIYLYFFQVFLLLFQYFKVLFLNINYTPNDLIEIIRPFFNVFLVIISFSFLKVQIKKQQLNF